VLHLRRGVLPLTDFGPASFSSVTVKRPSLATFHPLEIVMPAPRCRPSNASRRFTVSYTGLSRASPVSLVRTSPFSGFRLSRQGG